MMCTCEECNKKLLEWYKRACDIKIVSKKEYIKSRQALAKVKEKGLL